MSHIYFTNFELFLIYFLSSNHKFDEACNRKKKPRRKLASLTPVDEPAKGAKPIRQHHKCDETKIPAHIRHGVQMKDMGN